MTEIELYTETNARIICEKIIKNRSPKEICRAIGGNIYDAQLVKNVTDFAKKLILHEIFSEIAEQYNFDNLIYWKSDGSYLKNINTRPKDREKFSEEQIIDIVKRFMNGEPPMKIASDYQQAGLNYSVKIIQNIVSGLNYKDITMKIPGFLEYASVVNRNSLSIYQIKNVARLILKGYSNHTIYRKTKVSIRILEGIRTGILYHNITKTIDGFDEYIKQFLTVSEGRKNTTANRNRYTKEQISQICEILENNTYTIEKAASILGLDSNNKKDRSKINQTKYYIVNGIYWKNISKNYDLQK